MVWYRSDPTGHEVELVTYKVEDLLLVPVLIYAGDNLGGMWLSPTSRLSTGLLWIIIPLCMAISFNSFATTVSSMGAVDRPKDSALNWYVRPWT